MSEYPKCKHGIGDPNNLIRCKDCETQELQAELEQEKSYSSDLKKQLAGTRGIVDKQAEEIEKLQADLVCQKDDLEKADNVVVRLQAELDELKIDYEESTNLAYETIEDLKNELRTRPPLPLEGEARSRVLQALNAAGIDDAINKYYKLKAEIAELKAKLYVPNDTQAGQPPTKGETE